MNLQFPFLLPCTSIPICLFYVAYNYMTLILNFVWMLIFKMENYKGTTANLIGKFRWTQPSLASCYLAPQADHKIKFSLAPIYVLWGFSSLSSLCRLFCQFRLERIHFGPESWTQSSGSSGSCPSTSSAQTSPNWNTSPAALSSTQNSYLAPAVSSQHCASTDLLVLWACLIAKPSAGTGTVSGPDEDWVFIHHIDVSHCCLSSLLLWNLFKSKCA